MTHVLANELRGKNITANAVAPGPTATDLFLKGQPQEVVDRITKLAPLERLGQPVDIASVVAFLAGPDARLGQRASPARQRRNRLIAAEVTSG